MRRTEITVKIGYKQPARNHPALRRDRDYGASVLNQRVLAKTLKHSNLHAFETSHLEPDAHQQNRSHRAPEVFGRVAQRARLFLENLEKDLSESEMSYVRSRVSRRGPGRINYDRFAESFAYLYFLQNFWKAAHTFLKEHPPLAERVIDAGCGSGASALAYLTFAEHRQHGTRLPIKVSFLDRSKAQLQMARRLLETVRVELPHVEPVPEFKLIDLRQWKPQESSSDAILFGHVLSENPAIVSALIQKASVAISSNGRVFVLERLDDSIWEEIEKCVPSLALSFYLEQVEVGNSIAPLRLLPKGSPKPYIRTRYLVIVVPEQKWVAGVLRSYFQSWQTRSITRLRQVFAPSARYFVHPHDPPLQGVKEIEEYWLQKVLPQKDIELKILGVAYAKYDAFAEWEAKFRRRDCRFQLKGALVIRTSPVSRRGVSLHEYFESKKA